MSRRLSFLVILLALLAMFAGMVQVRSVAPLETAVALISVALPTDEALTHFEDLGLSVYARLEASFLAGADPDGLEALAQSGLAFRVLDANITDLLKGRSTESLYLAYVRPGQPRPDWDTYGRLLLDEAGQALLRMLRADAEQLSLAGVELQSITFDPKPLRPMLTGIHFPEEITPDPYVRMMIGQVLTDTVYQYDGDLSGEWSVLVGGEPYTITTRHTYSGVPIQKATQFVGEHLQNLGLDVEYHQWGGETYPNVIGELPGLIDPEDIFIICAHLDDMPSGPLAPGADDNASGSTAVMIAADILTQYRWGCTLRFALWTGEEQGLDGSHAYAQRAYNRGENIVGVLNLDMISWNTPMSSPDIDLAGSVSIPGSMELAQLFADVVDAYGLNLIPQIRSGGGGSDHASFWQYGYTAILAIEDTADFNPYYHTPQDLLEHLDIAYFTQFVKGSVGTFVHMSDCLIPSGIGYLDGHVTTAGSGNPIRDADVTILDEAGHPYTVTTDSDGYYTHTLRSGFYTVTASAYGHFSATVHDVLVVTDTVTTQDFALELAPTYVISGSVTEFGTGVPLAAQVIFINTPVAVSTDPSTGYYEATVAEGSYTMRARADWHRSEERPIVVDRDQTQDFSLGRMPCVLLVDDDIDGPDVRAYYTSTLDTLRISYDVWDINWVGGPSVEDLLDYHTVVWFTGHPWSMTLSNDDEAALAAYLEDGGTLFFSSKDYLYDVGLRSFGQNYLGIAGFTDNVEQIDPIGNAGHPIGDGLGPYTLVLPPGWDDFRTDHADGVQSSPFRWQGIGQNNSTSYDEGSFKSVFLAWPFEGLDSLSDRTEVMGRIIGWFGGCGADGWLVGQVTDAASGEGLAGATVRASVFETATDPTGHYTLTMPAGLYQVRAAKAGYVPQTISGVEVQAGLTTTQDFALEPWICEPVYGVDFSWLPLTPTVGQVVTLTGEATGTLPITYSWELGDGSLASGQVVTHSYSLPDVYRVAMTATNCITATAASVHTIAVTCEAVEILTVTRAISGCVVNFGAVLSGTTPYTYNWDFGAFGTSTETNPVIDFGATGTYTVTLHVYNCLDGHDMETFAVDVACAVMYDIYLPVVFKNYRSSP